MKRYRILKTPTGPFAILRDEDGRIQTRWLDSDETESGNVKGASRDGTLEQDLVDRLNQYFAGNTVDFSDVPTPRGGDFFQQCWQTCRAIPRGQTRTYGQLAEAAGGNASASRAAGQAMRNNPLPVIIPCHRVVGAGGGLGGFAGSDSPGGMELNRKSMLLHLEGVKFGLADV